MPTELFDPMVDGWFFGNWGETSEFNWDLFRETYLGVNPTENCVEASLDCAFFELFKICAKNGNCGGMSLLALALYKYGGYFGFCKPANFYTGDVSDPAKHIVGGPHRADLHRAINIIQARQFNVNGIRNFLDMADAKTLNNAVIAHQRVKELLGKGDYPVLSISTGVFGDNAHTIIPYNYTDGPGWPKYLYIWDPNHPGEAGRMMTINGPTAWTYTSQSTTYSGTANGWCFAIPMSLALHKARHPLSVGMVINTLMTLFITGSGSAVGQISDENGRRLYSEDADLHTSRGDLETDPTKRLPACCRWPWYGKKKDGDRLPEVYFYRRNPGISSRLTISLNGIQYRAAYCGANNLVTVDSDSRSRGRELVTISALGTTHQSVDITPTQNARTIGIRQARMGTDTKSWRAFEVQNLDLMRGDAVTIDVARDFSSIVVSSEDREVPFNLRIEQAIGRKTVHREETDLFTRPGKLISFMPVEWRKLKKTSISKEEISIPGRLRQKTKT